MMLSRQFRNLSRKGCELSEVNVWDARRDWVWLCKQDTTRRRYWVRTFVKERGDENAWEILII